MSPRLHLWDRGLRLVAGIALLSFYGAITSPWRYLTLLGLPLIGTALVGWCPLYTLFPSGKGGAAPGGGSVGG